MYRTILFALFLVFTLCAVSPVHASGQSDPEFMLRDSTFIADVQQAIRLVYNQEFEASAEALEPWFEHRNGELLKTFWEGLPVWWEILADLETDKYDDDFIAHMEAADRASDLILRRDRRNLDALVIKSVTNGFLARLHANRGSWYKSLSHGRTAINILFTIEQLYPDVPDIQFGLGLYNYFTAHLNEQYRIVRAVSWMIPAGDKTEGLERLSKAAEESAFMIPEATYFLGHIYLHYEQETELAETYLSRLLEEYPGNAFFSRLMLRTRFQQRQFHVAAELNDSLISRFGPENHHPTMEELYTTRGLIHYRLGRFEEAETMFGKAIELENQLDGGLKRHHQLTARFHLARTYNRTGRTDEARQTYRTVAESRADSPYVDRAKRILEQMSGR